MSVPQSIINICSGVRINNSYNDTLWFENTMEQRNYFAGKVVKTFSAYTFLRRSWSIKVQTNSLEQANTWNYLYFTNDPDQATWFYYFITKVEYVNDSTVELFLDLDVMQTYLFDFTPQYCFVERMHENTDIDIYTGHTVAENLDLGEMINVDKVDATELNELCILMQSTFDPLLTTKDETTTITAHKLHNNLFSGLYVSATSMADWEGLGTKLNQLNEWGKIDGVVNIWMYPKALVNLGSEYSWTDGTICKPVASARTVTVTIPKPEVREKNKKLNMYPFQFLYVTNNSGMAATYQYEKFSDTTNCQFKIEGCLTPEAVVRCTPMYYKGVQYNYDESITLSGYPTCAWNSDMYKIWLAQNQNQHDLATGTAGLSIIGGVVAGVTGLATGNLLLAGAGGTAMMSGINAINQHMAQKADMQVQPPQARGVQSSALNIFCGCQTFSFYKKQTDQLTRLDNYLTRYGYQVNDIRTPTNYTLMTGYCYVKTIDCIVTGNICNEDKVKLQSIFDKGVTFWMKPDSVGNYKIDND